MVRFRSYIFKRLRLFFLREDTDEAGDAEEWKDTLRLSHKLFLEELYKEGKRYSGRKGWRERK